MDEQASKLNEMRAQGGVMRGAQQINTDRYGDRQRGTSVFADVVAAGFFRDMVSMLRSVPSAQTGLDLITPFSSFSGGVAGGLSGAAIDLIPLVESSLAPAMATIGKEVGGFVGESLTRSFRIRDAYDRAYFQFRAVTGIDTGGVANLASIGFDNPAVASMMMKIAQAAGTGRGAYGGAQTLLGIQRGYGIDESILLGAMGTERMGGGSGRSNVQRALGIS